MNTYTSADGYLMWSPTIWERKRGIATMRLRPGLGWSDYKLAVEASLAAPVTASVPAKRLQFDTWRATSSKSRVGAAVR